MNFPPPNKTMADYVRMAKQGDREAFDRLLTLTEKRLFRFCLFLCGNQVRAQDLCQSTFIRAFEKIRSLKNNDAFESWLFTIAKGLYLNELRKSPRGKMESIEDVEIPATVHRHELKDLIRSILSMLNETDRMALLLVAMEEYSYEEAAKILEISLSALNARVRRAKENFIEKLREQQVEITGIFELKRTNSNVA